LPDLIQVIAGCIKRESGPAMEADDYAGSKDSDQCTPSIGHAQHKILTMTGCPVFPQQPAMSWRGFCFTF
jgi:hypothetical protein